MSIRKLPVELLAQVFYSGITPLPSETFMCSADGRTSTCLDSNFQLKVGAVCRHWREISISQSIMWTTLHFGRPEHLERGQAFIQRCAKSSHLLTILVETAGQAEHTPGFTLHQSELTKVFNIIAPHVARWRSFHLKIRDVDCKTIARDRLSTCGGAPNLETLQLYHFEDFDSPSGLERATVRSPVRIFEGCLPKLKNISLIGVNLAWDGAAAYLCNLVHLEFALHRESVRPTYEQWAIILNGCRTSLASLSLHYSGPRLPLSPVSPTNVTTALSETSKIQLPSLRALSLTSLDAPHLCILFNRLEVPEVRTLSLDLPEGCSTDFVHLISGTSSTASSVSAASVFPRLEHLTVTALVCSVESWVDLLTSIPRLKTLDVDFEEIGARDTEPEEEDEGDVGLSREGFFEALLAAPVVLPQLRSIKVSGLAGTEISQLLDHREKKSCQIQSWSIRWCEGWKGRDKEVDRLIEDGWRPHVQIGSFERGAMENMDDEWDDEV